MVSLSCKHNFSSADHVKGPGIKRVIKRGSSSYFEMFEMRRRMATAGKPAGKKAKWFAAGAVAAGAALGIAMPAHAKGAKTTMAIKPQARVEAGVKPGVGGTAIPETEKAPATRLPYAWGRGTTPKTEKKQAPKKQGGMGRPSEASPKSRVRTLLAKKSGKKHAK